jgi:hypothetical protein
MKRYLLSAICLTMFVQSSSLASTHEEHFKMLVYDIFFDGKDVGDMTLKLSKDEDRYLIVEQSHIKASGWWWDLNIITVLSEELDQSGVLKESDGKTLGEGSIYWTKISTYEDWQQVDYTLVDKVTDEDKKQFSELSFAVTGLISNNIEEIVSRSKSMFTGRENHAESAKFSKDTYDTTWNSLPLYIQKHSGKVIPGKLKILDSDNLEIVQVNLEDLGYDSLSVGSNVVQARHLRVSDGKFKPADLWIDERRNGPTSSLPYYIRHTGEDEDGTFEIILKPH